MQDKMFCMDIAAIFYLNADRMCPIVVYDLQKLSRICYYRLYTCWQRCTLYNLLLNSGDELRA